jgi:hypothetical protein
MVQDRGKPWGVLGVERSLHRSSDLKYIDHRDLISKHLYPHGHLERYRNLAFRKA